jgi:hypothetical protein
MSSAEDILVKPFKITLDKERNLLYDMNAFIELEQRFGSVENALEELGKKANLKSVRTILWAGLVHEDENLQEKDVFRGVSLGSLQDITEILMTAIEQSMPKNDGKNVQKATQPTE